MADSTKLTISEALGAIVAAQEDPSPSDFIRMLREMQIRVLDWRFPDASPHSDVLDLVTGEWIYLHSTMTSDDVDDILSAVFH